MAGQIDIDDVPLRFGKHRGMSPRQIAQVDPSYIVWLHANVLPAVCSRDLALDCEESMQENCDMDDDTDLRDMFIGDRD